MATKLNFDESGRIIIDDNMSAEFKEKAMLYNSNIGDSDDEDDIESLELSENDFAEADSDSIFDDDNEDDGLDDEDDSLDSSGILEETGADIDSLNNLFN